MPGWYGLGRDYGRGSSIVGDEVVATCATLAGWVATG
jgi:hypothetical protein